MKRKNTKEKLNSLSLNDLTFLYNSVRKAHSCLIFLSENYASNLKLLSTFLFFVKWTERSAFREQFGRTFVS